jgi:hypothetical protein
MLGFRHGKPMGIGSVGQRCVLASKYIKILGKITSRECIFLIFGANQVHEEPNVTSRSGALTKLIL